MTGILVDTNILVYLADMEDGKHEAATQWFEDSIKHEDKYFVSLQNLREFAKVALSKADMGPSEVNGWVESFSRVFRVLPDSKEDILMAVRISHENSMHFWDANIVATMERHYIKTIMTENNRDFRKYKKVKIAEIFSSR